MAEAKKPKPASSFNFSDSMQELEEITEYLESTDTDLDKALEKFKRGTELVKQLELHLEEAQNKVKTIRSDIDK
jgi:exodeoxyribonuclease VII small subunit